MKPLSQSPLAVALTVLLLSSAPVGWTAWRLHEAAQQRDRERFELESAKPLSNMRSWLIRLRQQTEQISSFTNSSGNPTQDFHRNLHAIPSELRLPDVRSIGLLDATGRLLFATTTRATQALARIAADDLRAARASRVTTSIRFEDTGGARMLFLVSPETRGRIVFLLLDWDALLERALRTPPYVVDVAVDPTDRPARPGRFVREETVEECGLRVTLRLTPKPVFWRDSQRNSVWIAAGMGVLVAALLAVLAGVHTAQRSLLARRVQERTAELETANAQLRRAIEQEKELQAMKTEFISLVTHELRTPLQAIASSADILARYDGDLPPAQRREQLNAIGTAVQRISSLSEEVLLFSRLEAGRIRPEPVELDIDRWTRELLERFPNGPERLHLKGSAPGLARLDERLLRHALGNLLDNALKYSPVDAPVQVELSRDGQDVRFVVADLGPGIPPEDMPKLMEGFHRGANVLHIPGTGLGLVVVKRCIERCGGTVSIGNRPGGGTRAEIRLPAFEDRGT